MTKLRSERTCFLLQRCISVRWASLLLGISFLYPSYDVVSWWHSVNIGTYHRKSAFSPPVPFELRHCVKRQGRVKQRSSVTSSNGKRYRHLPMSSVARALNTRKHFCRIPAIRVQSLTEEYLSRWQLPVSSSTHWRPPPSNRFLSYPLQYPRLLAAFAHNSSDPVVLYWRSVCTHI